MITSYILEDYCSEELSSSLAEKGYVGATNIYLDKDGWRVKQITLQSAMKWLRKVHNQIIVPSIRVEDPISGIINCYIVGIWYIPKNNGGAFCYTSPTPYNGYSSFEEACEAAIKYCLENFL